MIRSLCQVRGSKVGVFPSFDSDSEDLALPVAETVVSGL